MRKLCCQAAVVAAVLIVLSTIFWFESQSLLAQESRAGIAQENPALPFLPTPQFTGPSLSLSVFGFRANGVLYAPTHNRNLQIGLGAGQNSGLVVISIAASGYEVYSELPPDALFVSANAQLNLPTPDLTAIPLYTCVVSEGRWRYCEGPPRYIVFAGGPQPMTVFGLSPMNGQWSMEAITQ
jgi:hypothetical protein